jgi:hypothetical protein
MVDSFQPSAISRQQKKSARGEPIKVDHEKSILSDHRIV